jgi:hypothetical protein
VKENREVLSKSLSEIHFQHHQKNKNEKSLNGNCQGYQTFIKRSGFLQMLIFSLWQIR